MPRFRAVLVRGASSIGRMARNGLFLLLALVLTHAEGLKPAEAPRSAVRRSINPGLARELKPSLVPRSGHDLVAAKTEVCLRCPNAMSTLGSIQPATTRTAQASDSSVAVGVLAVLGGVLIHLACGSMYTWGNLISIQPQPYPYPYLTLTLSLSLSNPNPIPIPI